MKKLIPLFVCTAFLFCGCFDEKLNDGGAMSAALLKEDQLPAHFYVDYVRVYKEKKKL